MNVGILTFQFAHNYGAMLQCYSLKTYLENMNNDVIVINYIPNKMASFYSLNPIYAIKRKDIKALKNNMIRIKQFNKFNHFQKNSLKLRKKISSVNDSTISKLDSIVVGSDQVWNYDIVPDLNEYLLSKCTSCNKVAYSASLGKKDISDKAMKMFSEQLLKFSGISVREKNNSVYLSNKLGINVKHTVDPVFLLSKEQWQNLSEKATIDKINKEYILFIDLFNSKELEEKAFELASKENIKVYTIDPLCRNSNKKTINLHDVGPIDYLYLINNAKYVVTNSFHAVAFSSIFNKKLVYYLNNELSNRITELFEDMKIVPKNDLVDFKANGISDSYNELIKYSKNYLRNILSQYE